MGLLYGFLSILGVILSAIVLIHVQGYLTTKRFCKLARSSGLKVYELPYAWFGFSIFIQFTKFEKTHGDAAYHYKNIGNHHDLIVSNALHRVVV